MLFFSRRATANRSRRIRRRHTSARRRPAAIAASVEALEVRLLLAGTALVANSADDTVSVVSLDSLAAIDTIAVGDDPRSLAVTPDGSQAYVVNLGSNSVSAIDIESGTVVHTIPVGNNPRDVVFNHDGTRAFVSNSASASVSVIDTATATLIDLIPTPPNPWPLEYHPVRDELWIGFNSVGTVLQVRNALDFSVIASRSSSNRSYASTGMDFSPDGAQLISVENCGLCGRFHRISGNTAGGSIQILQQDILYDNTGGALDADINPVTGVAYLAKLRQSGSGMHRITELGGAARTLAFTGLPLQMDVSEDGARLYVSVAVSGVPGYVAVVDTTTFSVIDTVTVGNRPEGIVLTGSSVAQPDLVATNLSIDGNVVNFGWRIDDADLPADTTVALYWSHDATFDASDTLALAAPIPITGAGREVGSYSDSVPRSEVNQNRNGASHLLLVVDPGDLIAESREDNNETDTDPTLTYVFFHGGFQLLDDVADGLNELRLRAEQLESVVVSNVIEFEGRGGHRDIIAPQSQVGIAKRELASFLHNHGYARGDLVVLIGHSYGGNVVYQLAGLNGIDALVTVDPIDWRHCGVIAGFDGCDQSELEVDIPGRLELDKVFSIFQRKTVGLQGYSISNAIQFESDAGHTHIDCDHRVHGLILAFLRRIQGPTPLQALASYDATSVDQVMAGDEVNQIVVEALSRFEALSAVNVLIADLPDGQLADASSGVITFDTNAAGAGWFIDPTPQDHSEFTLAADGTLVAAPGSPAYGHYDLLTVALHEIGHLLGFEHEESGLMADTLPSGVRRLPLSHPVADDPLLVLDSALVIDSESFEDAAPEPVAPVAPWLWEIRRHGSELDDADEPAALQHDDGPPVYLPEDSDEADLIFAGLENGLIDDLHGL